MEHQPAATVALVVLVTLLVARVRRAVKVPSGRLTWLATASGCLAFTTVGVIVPLHVIDGWLGGTNVVNWLQNSLATTAFWLLLQATRTLDGSRFLKRSMTGLPCMIVAFSVPFILIPERGPTSANFIEDHADKPALWAYASIYMTCVMLMMLRAFREVRDRQPKQYVLIRWGVISIAVASAIEVAYLTSRVLGASGPLVDLAGDAFVLPFYGGVVVAAAGIAGFTAQRWVRTTGLRTLRVALARVAAARGLDVAALSPDASAHDTYKLAVAVTDLANTATLHLWERAVLRVTAAMLDRQMRAPRVVKLSTGPRMEMA